MSRRGPRDLSPEAFRLAADARPREDRGRGSSVRASAQPRRRRCPAARLVLALERPGHAVRSPDRVEGRRVAQLLHGLDRPPGGIASSRVRLPLPAKRGRFLRRGPRRADHYQQDPGRPRPDRDSQGDGGPRRSPGPPLEGAAQLLPGERPRRRLLPRPRQCPAGRRAVYRYVRRVFSPRFAPIDGDNVWGRILPEVRLTPVWQGLAARAAAEEDRASARTRAGHAARKDAATETDPSLESAATPPFFAPALGDGTAITATGNDSSGVSSLGDGETSVVGSNTGLRVDVGGTNRGSSQKRRSSVAPINEAGQTDVAPSNTTYHQHSTTTKDAIDEFEDKSPVVRIDGGPTIGR